MMLNRVGQEKDLRAIIQNTAKHVGLSMPKGWREAVKDPFEKRDTNTEPTKWAFINFDYASIVFRFY